MSALGDYSLHAQLAFAAYATLTPGAPDEAALVNPAGMSQSQASQFAADWKVVDQHNDRTGLSVTVFEDQAGERYLAIRGTEPSPGDLTADLLLAHGLPAQLNPQFVSLKAKI